MIIPDYVKSAPKSKADETAQPSMHVLTTTLNGRFIHKCGADEKNLGTEVSIVILGIKPEEQFINQKAFWPLDQELGGPPICISDNGVKPASFITAPQSEMCDVCRWNQPGSAGKVGRQARGCKTFKTVYAAFSADLALGNINTFMLRVPVTSLRNLSSYRWELKQHEVPIAGVETIISFDPEREYTVLTFRFGKFLNKEVFKLSTDVAANKLTKALPDNTSQTQEAYETMDAMKQTEFHKLEDTESFKKMVEELPDTTINNTFDQKVETDTQPTTTDQDADILDSMFGSDKMFLNTAIKDIQGLSKEEIAGYLKPHKEAIEALSGANRKALSEAIKKILSEPIPLVDKLRTQIADLVTADELMDMLEKLKTIDTVDAEVLKETFIAKANLVNNTVFDTTKHSISRNPVGYPSFTKDGHYRMRRNSTKEKTDVVTESNSTAIAALDDILSDLEKF